MIGMEARVFSGGIGLSAATIVVWMVAIGLVVWQAVLTWMVTRDRGEAGDEAHRLGRLAAAVDELGERFEAVARHSLAELDRRAQASVPEPEPVPCHACEGSGWVRPEPVPATGAATAGFEPGPAERAAAIVPTDPPRFSVVGGGVRPWGRPDPYAETRRAPVRPGYRAPRVS